MKIIMIQTKSTHTHSRETEGIKLEESWQETSCKTSIKENT